MQKKDIKGRRPSRTSSTHKRYTSSKTHQVKRRVEKNKTNDRNIKIACGLGIVAILLLCYLTFGIIMTLLTAVGIAIIVGAAQLLRKVKNQKRKKRILNFFLIIFLFLGICGLAAFSAFMIYIKVEADPKFKEEQLNTKEITILYDKDDKEFAKLGSEKREKIKYDQMPEVLVDAIVATEDSRYFQHNGFDAPRFAKAAVGQFSGNSGAGGASTITMQVVKNSFTDAKADSGVAGIIRKFEDIYLAVFKLEKNYSKEQILEFYVNNHFLGGNIYGVEEASRAYFGKSVTDLNLSEAAILAGMFKSPNYYRPNVNPINATERRKTVLYLMKKHGYITKEEQDLANSIPVESLTVEPTAVTANKYQGYIDTVVQEVKDTYKVNPYTTSLKVYTNLDRSRQDAVNSVLSGQTYGWINDRVQTGVAVLDSETGKIIAIGNGRNINGRTNANLSQLNYATDIRRQPGSTAKPLFDYGPGIEYNDWSTYQMFNDAPYTYSGGRSIKNWDGGYYGNITLRRALSASRNIPALKAFQQVENKKIAEFVTNLGITPEICPSGYNYNHDENNCYNPKNKNDVVDTIALHEAHSIGAFTGVSPLEMAAAYAAFSNGGYYNEPYSVSKILYRSTNKEVEHKANKRKVMSDATAFMISSVLQDVALTGGTPKNVACKTGTTNFDEITMNRYNMPGDAIRDSWVIGYSTKTVIGMWYGYDDFTKESIAQGYVLHNVPATIQKDRLFNALVSSGAMESNREAFKMPNSVVKIGIAAGTNPPKLAGPGSAAIYEYFKKGKEPTETDYSSYTIPAPSGLSVTLNEATGQVTLSWRPTSPGPLGKSEYGTFGYNVYYGSELLDWTSGTSYSFTPADPYQSVYKVIGTYKGYNEVKSAAATATLTKKVEPVEPETPEDPGENPTP